MGAWVGFGFGWGAINKLIVALRSYYALPILMTAAAVWYGWRTDEQNSTVYITDIGQGIENSYLYDAFGAIKGRQEGIHNRILYTGQQHDQVTGQHYPRARYYNPVLGRFLQEDVYRGDGLNLYAYCDNNPGLDTMYQERKIDISGIKDQDLKSKIKKMVSKRIKLK